MLAYGAVGGRSLGSIRAHGAPGAVRAFRKDAEQTLQKWVRGSISYLLSLLNVY